VVRTCAQRGYLNAFEVGLFEPLTAEELSARITAFQRDINRKLGDSQTTPDGKMETLRQSIALLRKKQNPADTSQAIDRPFLVMIKSP
jgi:hypothetical protein